MANQASLAKVIEKKAREWKPDMPLDNDRHELFCQHYAGDCFGDIGKAYALAGFSVGNGGKYADSCGKRMLEIRNVCDRLRYLRGEKMKLLAVDQAMIMKRRLDMLDNCEVSWDTKVKILKDMEAALGLVTNGKASVTNTVTASSDGITTGTTTIQFVE